MIGILVPRRKRVLLTPLKPEAAGEALFHAVMPRAVWAQQPALRGQGHFMGEVTPAGFSIARDTRRRSNFAPFITGTFGYDGVATRVEVAMKLHPVIEALSGIAAAIALVVLALGIKDYFSAGGSHGDPAAIVFPGGILLFGLGMVHSRFQTEARRAEGFLCQIMQAQVERPPDPNRAI